MTEERLIASSRIVPWRDVIGNRWRVTAAVAAPPVSAQQAPPMFQLTWVDRQGAMTRIGALPPGTFAPRLSPDGRRVAFDTFDGSVWIADLANLAAARRFGAGRFPMWSPDGSRLLFAGPKGFQLFWQASDGSGAPELIADTARAPESWSAATRLVSYITLTGAADYDVWTFSPEDRSQRALLATPTTAQMGSRFSPDGKWLAYQSNESGRYEIYVEPFPRTGARTPSHRRAAASGRCGRPTGARSSSTAMPRSTRSRSTRPRRSPREPRSRCPSRDSCSRPGGASGMSRLTGRAS